MIPLNCFACPQHPEECDTQCMDNIRWKAVNIIVDRRNGEILAHQNMVLDATQENRIEAYINAMETCREEWIKSVQFWTDYTTTGGKGNEYTTDCLNHARQQVNWFVEQVEYLHSSIVEIPEMEDE